MEKSTAAGAARRTLRIEEEGGNNTFLGAAGASSMGESGSGSESEEESEEEEESVSESESESEEGFLGGTGLRGFSSFLGGAGTGFSSFLGGAGAGGCSSFLAGAE